MPSTPPQPEWPPPDAKAFIHGPEFGEDLLALAFEQAQKNPTLDFTDAVAHVFAWFDKKLKKNRRFINRQRFPTRGHFRAYLGRALWNAALMARRDRQRFTDIEALPVDRMFASFETHLDEKLSIQEILERLAERSELHRTVFERCCIDEAPHFQVARELRLPEEEVHRLYEEATDLVAQLLLR